MSAGWSSTSLGALVDIKHGFAFKGEHITDQETENLLLTPGNFAIGGGFKFGKQKFYSGDVSSDYVLSPGDLIVTMTDLSKEADTLGYGAIVPQSPFSMLHNQRIGKVILKSKDASLEFLHWVMRTPEYRNEILANYSGSTVKHTSPTKILAYKFALPPCSEQREIAATLGALDDKIELNRKTAVTLEEMARALYRSWFVDFDPVRARAEGRAPAHMDPATAALFPDSFGEDGLPVGWATRRLGSVCTQVKQTVKPRDAPASNFWHFSLPAFDAASGPILEAGAQIKSNKTFVPNDAILFSRLNPTIPRIWWARADHALGTPAASTEFFVAVPHCKAETSWLYCLLSSEEFQEQAVSRVTGTSNSHQRVSATALSDIEITAPVTEIAVMFGNIADDWFERIHSLAQENRTLAALRDTLLPRLMSGELRVGAAREMLEEVA